MIHQSCDAQLLWDSYDINFIYVCHFILFVLLLSYLLYTSYLCQTKLAKFTNICVDLYEHFFSVRTGLEGPGLRFAQKLWYCIATVGGHYTWTRLHCFLLLADGVILTGFFHGQRSVTHWAWYIIQRIKGFYKAASFTNILIFLYTGRYRNLIERVLRARLVYGSPHMNRAEDGQNELQLESHPKHISNACILLKHSTPCKDEEMLLLLLPILNSASIKSVLHPFSKDKSSGFDEDETLCPIYQVNPTIAYVALPCQHRYCYYCLRTRCGATISFRCSRCSEPVVVMQRHGLINT